MKRAPLFCLLLLGLSAAVPAAEQDVPRVVVMIVDKMDPADLADPALTNMAWAAAHGGAGLMNTRTGGPSIAENAYVTIGAGNRSLGPSDTGRAYAAAAPLEGGTAAEILRRNTGFHAGPESLVLPGVAAVRALNATQDRSIVPGLLGEELRRAGLRTCVLGNSDQPGLPGRYGVSLAMDTRGVVDMGLIGQDILRADVASPFGCRIDGEALLRAFDRFAGRADLVVIDLGDLARVNAYAPNLTPDRLAVLRREALQRADALLGELRVRLDDFRRTLFMMLSPSPTASRLETDQSLTPVLVTGPGFAPGWLSSNATKRPGLVANTDVAPTILSYLGLQIPSQMNGRPICSVPGRDGLSGLLAEDERITAVAYWQKPVLRFLTGLLDTVFIISAVFLLWTGLPGRRLVRVLLLFTVGLPLAMLLVPLLPEALPPPAGLAVLSALITAVSVVLGRRRPLFALGLPAAGIAAAIAVDQLCGGYLARYSLLSYSPVVGARYYGIGNEYMGVLIGAAVMAAGIARTRWPRERWSLAAVGAGFVFLIVVLGAPVLGSNVGGTLAAVAGFGGAFLLLSQKKLSWRRLCIGLAAAAGVLVVLAVIDSLRDPSLQTHLGRAVRMLGRGEAGEFLQLIQRKIAMNIKLVRYSGWSRAALLALAAMGVTALFPRGRGSKLRARYPQIARAIQAALIAAAAAFCFNDSGVVAAGTLLIFPAVVWMYLLMEERKSFVQD